MQRRPGSRMISLGKAKQNLERWLLGDDSAPSTVTRGEATEEKSASGDRGNYDQRLRLFMDELEASSQEWLGRVRLIDLESVRQHLGPAWAKLQDRVELLAEKLIRGEMTGRDKFLNMGGAEFLVFFADATPEESRIRCLAIVEAIHEKLFGFEDQAGNSPHRVAECHVIHRDELALEWEAENAANRAGQSDRSATEVLRRSFRQNAELLDGTDVATSTQIALDSIIIRGTESRNMDELAPLLARLKALARSLKTLEPVLIATRRAPQGREDNDDPGGMPLGTAWDDIVELISVLDAGHGYSHTDLLTALGKLQSARWTEQNVRMPTKTCRLPGSV